MLLPTMHLREIGSNHRCVALVTSCMRSGGAERAASTMANYWAAKGWTIHILSLDNLDAKSFYPLHPGVQLRSLNLFQAYGSPVVAIFQLIHRAWRLRRAITATNPDWVISFDDVTNVLTGFSMIGLDVPVIAAERNDPRCHALKTPWRFFRIWAYSRARHVVAQTRHALEFFPPHILARGRVIPNPVPVAGPSQNGDTLLAPGPACVVLAMGRLEIQKGFDMLIRAFHKASATHLDWKLEIWGEGSQRNRLESMIADTGITERISLRGVTNDPFTEMRKAGIFVLSSRYEGFPNVLCEAMACGVPCISFDCHSGPAEIIRDGLDGVLVPKDAVNGLAKALDSLMSNPQERVRLGSSATEVTQRCGLEKIMGLWG